MAHLFGEEEEEEVVVVVVISPPYPAGAHDQYQSSSAQNLEEVGAVVEVVAAPEAVEAVAYSELNPVFV